MANQSTQQFETWEDGLELDYAVYLTQQGSSGRWIGDLPQWITTPGCYPAEVYSQGGCVPDVHGEIQDKLIAVGSATRAATSGSDILVPGLSQYALTGLAQQKNYQRIITSATDGFLITLINAVSAKVERICGRSFLKRPYKSWYMSDRQVILDNFPVESVDSVLVGKQTAINIQYTGSGGSAGPAIKASVAIIPGVGVPDTGGTSLPDVDGIDSPDTEYPEVPAGLMRLTAVDSDGTQSTNQLDFQTYKSTSTLTEAINSVGGWQASLIHNVPSTDLMPFPGCDALNSGIVGVFYPDQDDSTNITSIDYDLGIIYRQQRSIYSQYSYESYVVSTGRYTVDNQLQLLVSFTAGYSTIPADLVLVVNQLVADAYNMGLNDRTMKSERLGDYSYMLADRLQINLEQREILKPFTRIALGTRVR